MELTYGTAVGLAETLIPLMEQDGVIEYGVILNEEELQNSILLITKVMPWGVLAASSIKLSNRLVGFLDKNKSLKLDVWNDTKRLIISNTPTVARITQLNTEDLGRYVQSFVNDNILTFLIGENINDVVNPASWKLPNTNMQ